jgi:hypothetical protein
LNQERQVIRNIKTKFYINKRYSDPVRVNSSSNANVAVARCILHLQIGHYNADAAEVYDDETGELHAQIKRSVNGNIVIVYKRDPLKFQARLAIGSLF